MVVVAILLLLALAPLAISLAQRPRDVLPEGVIPPVAPAPVVPEPPVVAPPAEVPAVPVPPPAARPARKVGFSPPASTSFVLRNDVNYGATRMKAGKVVSAKDHDLAKLRLAGAVLAPYTDAGVPARTAEIQAESVSGQDPTFETARRVDAFWPVEGGGGPPPSGNIWAASWFGG